MLRTEGRKIGVIDLRKGGRASPFSPEYEKMTRNLLVEEKNKNKMLGVWRFSDSHPNYYWQIDYETQSSVELLPCSFFF